MIGCLGNQRLRLPASDLLIFLSAPYHVTLCRYCPMAEAIPNASRSCIAHIRCGVSFRCMACPHVPMWKACSSSKVSSHGNATRPVASPSTSTKSAMPSDVAKRILEVPVIDIGALMTCQDDATVGQVLREDNPALREVIVNVRAAAAEWGFFYIKNHGVSEVQMQRFQNAMRAFFALPNDAKNLLRRSKTNQRGYSDHEFTKQLLDNKEVFDVGGPAIDGPPGDGVERLAQEQNQWPADNVLPGFRATMTEYFSDMTHIARRLIQVFAVALGERRLLRPVLPPTDREDQRWCGSHSRPHQPIPLEQIPAIP